MVTPWYEWKDARRRLVAFARIMQGRAPYDVVIEPNPNRCKSAYCSFAYKVIAVNPTFFRASAKEQYQLTKALIVHEAGHRRFTFPARLPSVVSQVANILEDERVERKMCEEFPGVRWLIHKLSEGFHARTRPLDENTDSPGQVVFYFLHLRWAQRIGKPVKGGLSAQNRLLWQEIAPLVHEAWHAETSEQVHEVAEKIAEALGFNQTAVAGGSMAYIDNDRKNNPKEETCPN